MPVGDREHNKQQAERDQHQSLEKLAHDPSRLLETGRPKLRLLRPDDRPAIKTASSAGLGSSVVPVQPFAHFLARFEKRDALLINRHMRAGSRIASGAGRAVLDRERPEPAKRDEGAETGLRPLNWRPRAATTPACHRGSNDRRLA